MVMNRHCPIGVPYYDDGEYCIGCGLCLAITEEEFIIAQKKLDAYLALSPQEAEDFIQEGAYFEGR